MFKRMSPPRLSAWAAGVVHVVRPGACENRPPTQPVATMHTKLASVAVVLVLEIPAFWKNHRRTPATIAPIKKHTAAAIGEIENKAGGKQALLLDLKEGLGCKLSEGHRETRSLWIPKMR
jgi:hypothetical protein